MKSLALSFLLNASGIANADQPTPATAPVEVVDSDLSREEALAGNHCEGDPRFESTRNRQAVLNVLYWGLDFEGRPDGRVHQGQIVVDQSRAKDVQTIFDVAFKTRFPIHSIYPISMFEWADAESMLANNTSGWNFRGVGSRKSCPPQKGGSYHASLSSGRVAIDINPVQNPYTHDGVVEPPGAEYNPSAPGTLTKEHPIVQLAVAARGSELNIEVCTDSSWECSEKGTESFEGLGWRWGGNWTNNPDYQHLEATGRVALDSSN